MNHRHRTTALDRRLRRSTTSCPTPASARSSTARRSRSSTSRRRSGSVFAIDNFDPNSQAAVLSRGLVGSLGERIVVASPIYKHHFDLRTGECLEAPEHSVRAYPARVAGGKVWVAA